MRLILPIFIAAAAQAWSGSGGISNGASNAYETELYAVMRAVKTVLPRQCYAIRTDIDLSAGEAEADPQFTCVDKKGETVENYTLERSAMPVEKIMARLPRLRDAVAKMDGDDPDGISLTINRRGIIHSQFVFHDIQFTIRR